MGLGYEGWVKVGNTFALGTGVAVPRARVRLESPSGYGGQIKTPVNKIGIGLPFNYDWDTFDGSVNFDVHQLLWDELKARLFDRQAAKEIKFSTRKSGLQVFTNSFWNSITISANEQSLLDGAYGFVAIEKTSYNYGDEYPNGKKGNDEAGGDQTLLCPLATGMAPPLNPSGTNINPLPFWNTKIKVEGTSFDFTNWALSFSQDVVKFFACEQNTVPQPPKYLAVGPMTVGFSGSYMFGGSFLGDTVDLIEVIIGTGGIKLKRCEMSTETDDLPSADSIVPLAVEYAAYEIE